MNKQGRSQPINIGVADSVKCIEGGKTEKVLNFALFTPAQKKVISSNLVKVGVARATLCHTLATPLE
jgi:hypothetical protein